MHLLIAGLDPSYVIRWRMCIFKSVHFYKHIPYLASVILPEIIPTSPDGVPFIVLLFISSLCLTFQITLLMTTCFLVAWLPYSVLSLASTYGKNLDLSGPTSLLPTLLAKASHVTNPVVYFTMNPRYKRHVPCCSVSLFKNWISFSSEACQDELDMKLKMLYRKNGLKELTDVTQPASTAGTTNTCLGSCTTMVFPPAWCPDFWRQLDVFLWRLTGDVF